MNKKILKESEIPVFLSETQIKARVKEIAALITKDFGDEEITLICTLKGSVIYFADLIRELKMPVHCEFLGVSSYGDQTRSSGEVKVTLDLTAPLFEKNVVLVEDIVDTGLTLSFVMEYLRARKPKKIKTTALLFKKVALVAKDLTIDYVGFEIPNRFVIGYGLDFAQQYRGLPFIGTLD